MKRLLIFSLIIIIALATVSINFRIRIENLALDKAQLKLSLDSTKMRNEVLEAQLRSWQPYKKPISQQQFQQRYDSLKTVMNYDPEKYRENGQ